MNAAASAGGRATIVTPMASGVSLMGRQHYRQEQLLLLLLSAGSTSHAVPGELSCPAAPISLPQSM